MPKQTKTATREPCTERVGAFLREWSGFVLQVAVFLVIPAYLLLIQWALPDSIEDEYIDAVHMCYYQPLGSVITIEDRVRCLRTVQERRRRKLQRLRRFQLWAQD